MIIEIIILGFKLVLAIVFIAVIQFLIKYFYLKYQFRKLPGTSGLPIIGIALELLNVPSEDQQEWYSKVSAKFNGDIFVMWVGTRPLINLQKPRYLEIILPSTVNITKSFIYGAFTPWLGNGLVTSKGEKWFHQRRLLTPAFHFGVLGKFTDVMFEKSLILNERFEKFINENPGKPLDIFDFISMYTLDVICETAMGVDMDLQRKPANAYSKAVHDFTNIAADRLIRPWLIWDSIFWRTKEGAECRRVIKVLHGFTSKVIEERVAKRQNTTDKREYEENDDQIGRPKRQAFLDILLEASENDERPLSIEEIREQVDTFMFAGHDTTATAISWILFAVGNEPDIQAKIHDEMHKVFGDDADKPATATDLTQLKYLDRVIKETLRLYPSAPYIFRDLSEDVILDGHKIPVGTCIGISIYDLHRDPEIWENPLEFNPDRFLPENSKGRHPYSYVPFSAGPRNCIGQKFAILELKVILSSIFRKWRVKSVKSPKEIKLQTDLILRCSKPIQLHLTPLID